jgi:hypothetical protein
MTIITIYSLFTDDIRVIALPKHVDDLFYGLSSFAMLCFTVEISASVYAIDGYFGNFFFWLDVISTVTMIPDIGWLWMLIVGGNDNSD